MVMRKALVVVMVMLMASVAFGAQVQKEIIDDTLSKSDAVSEADLNISDAKRVTFFMTLNNSATTAAVTATVTAATSLNGTDWTDISWMDVAGGVTPQTTETTTLTKQTYVGWIDNRLIAKYIRIRVKAVNLNDYPEAYGATTTADLNVSVVQDK
jgi:hypothetical protein